jgi:ParB-like chromosome segregation protein Spo0J
MQMGSSPALAMAKRIELWPLERLVPYERNARTHSPEQVAQIAASITEFGFLNPILVDGKDGVIAGHGRLAAAKDMGLAEVPVVVLDHLTPAQRRAYVIADNKLAEGSSWNLEMLAGELDALQFDQFDLNLLGFDADELGELLGNGEFDGADDEPGEDEDEGPNRGIALAIVLTPEELMQWRKAKAELGYSTDKAAFWKLVEDLLKEVAS